MLGGKKRRFIGESTADDTHQSMTEASYKKAKVGNYSLHDAIKDKDLVKLKSLLADGADVDSYQDNLTPLLLAIDTNFLEGMDELLKAGASTEAMCKTSLYAPLDYAVWKQNPEAVVILVKAGANRNDMFFDKLLKKIPKYFNGVFRDRRRKVSVALKEQGSLEFTATHPSFKIKHGPNNKNIFNYELELLTLLKLECPNDVGFATVNGKGSIYALVKAAPGYSRFFDVSKLLERSHLSYFRMPVPANPSSVLHGEDPRHLTKTDEETIHKYSQDYSEEPEGYHKINQFLYNSEESPFKFLTIEDEAIFVSTLRMLNAIFKIDPQLDHESEKTDDKSYRGEISTPKSEVTWRKFLTQYGGGITRQPAFMSTSTDRENDVVNDASVVITFSSPVKIDIPGPAGIDISKYSVFPDESERLLPPGYILWTKNETKKSKDNTKDVEHFEARVVMPLLNKDIVTTAEIVEFKVLYDLAVKVNKAEANRIVFHRFDCDSQELPPIPRTLSFKVPFLRSTYPMPWDPTTKLLKYNILMHACEHVYNEYLKNAYTDKSYVFDWSLETPRGTVQRPNHGLAYSLRIMVLVSVVCDYLQRFSIQGCFHLGYDEIQKLELATLFSVVGRQNDCSSSDNPKLYKEFREASAQAFRKYVLKYNPLKMTADEIAVYTNIVRNMGDPKHRGPKMDIINFARWIDLIRCQEEDQYQSSVINPINKFLPEGRTKELIAYTVELLIITGDRVLGDQNKRDYDKELFYSTSTCVKTCLQQILKVLLPVERLTGFERCEEKVVEIEESTWEQCRNRPK